MFVLLILAVIAVVGGFAYLEFTAPDIAFVTDKNTSIMQEQGIVIRRLYSSGVNADAFADLVESRQKSDIEFTEDDIFQAALAAGKPQFYPAFYLEGGLEKGYDGSVWSAVIRPEFTDSMDSSECRLSGLTAEITLEGGLYADEYSVQYIDDSLPSGVREMSATVITEERQGLLLDLDNAFGYNLKIKGTSGTITVLYSYDINNNSLFSKTMLTEQALQLQANVTIDANKGITVTYAPRPYSSIEEMEEYEGA